jgi:Predicted NAD/FAD-binding protein
MVKKLGSSIECGVNIQRVRREDKRVVIVMADGSEKTFDQVVFACHSDEALKLLEHPFEAERRILSAIPYRKNSVVLHTDENLLPKSRRAWSAWNYRLGNPGGLGASGVTSKADDFEISSKPATLSYNMNILQGISAEDTFIVTLNGLDKIDPNKILGEFNYSHPIFTLEGIDAQEDWKKINGANNTWFCGAYWSNGFHEDGCASGIRVAKHLGASW